MDDQSIPLSDSQLTEAGIMTPEKVEKIVGPSGSILLPWLNASRSDIEGDYIFDIEVGSTRPINKEIRKQDAIQLYSMLNQHPLVNQMELIRLTLEGLDVKDHGNLLKTDDQLQQEAKQRSEQQAQMSQMAMQAEQAKVMPKIQSDMAKAKLDSDTKIHIAETSAEVSLLTAGLQQEAAKSKADADKAKKTPEVD
jgi:hypothetical protein